MDKLKKIVYIVSGTLGIILMVFMLMHKVGLCAAVNPEDNIQGFFPIEYPLPINGAYFGSGLPVTDNIIQTIIGVSSNSVVDAICIHEVDVVNGIIQVQVFTYRDGFMTYDGTNQPDPFSCSFRFDVSQTSLVQYDYNTDSATLLNTFGAGSTSAILPYNGYSALPTSGYYFPYLTYVNLYPLWVASGELSYNGVTYFSNWSAPDSGGNVFDDYDFPAFESLPNDITDNSNPDYNLYSWLNGQNKSNYDYTKSIFDLLKGFFSWFTAPLDEDVLTNSWTNTDIGGIVSYVSGLGDTLKSLLGNGAPVPENLSFNCSITLLNHTFPYTIDFSWYQQIKTQFLTVFLTFFYAGAFLYFIKSIPSFINGVSGTMNNFTQAGGGSDD